jgi:hypothetical protein
MPYTRDEDGRINNFAIEPKMYQAEPGSKQEQRTYVIVGVVAAVLVCGLVAIAISVS